MSYSISEIACLELRNMFSPVRDLTDPDGIRHFFEELGCPIDTVSNEAVNSFKEAVGSFDTLTTLLTEIGNLEQQLNQDKPDYIRVEPVAGFSQ